MICDIVEFSAMACSRALDEDVLPSPVRADWPESLYRREWSCGRLLTFRAVVC